MKKLFVLLLILTGHSAFAGELSWQIIGAKVRFVDYGQEYGGNYVLRVGLSDFDFSSIDSAGCPLTTTHGIIGRSSGGHSNLSNSLASIAMSAQAQDLLVDVLVDSRSCNTNGGYKNIAPNGDALPSGFGHGIRSLRIRRPD